MFFMKDKINVVIITGLSGAGKTKAIGILEDLGFFCVDNLPPTLIKDFIDLVKKTEGRINKLGMVVDVRSGKFLQKLPEIIRGLKRNSDLSVKLVFLEASDEALIKRFSETRRKHPVSEGSTIQQKIAIEKEKLAYLRNIADYKIDTSNFSLKDLKTKIISVVSYSGMETLDISIVTFGFKFGIPLQSDIVMDVRFIPNPFYVKGLENKTGKDEEVKKYVLQFSETREFLEKFEDLLVFLIPHYIAEGKSYLTISLGCTGGKHRSVALGEIIGDYLKNLGYIVKIEHRDVLK